MSSFTSYMSYLCKSSRKNNTYLQGMCYTLGTLHTSTLFFHFFPSLPLCASQSSTFKCCGCIQVTSNQFRLRVFWHVTHEAREDTALKSKHAAQEVTESIELCTNSTPNAKLVLVQEAVLKLKKQGNRNSELILNNLW